MGERSCLQKWEHYSDFRNVVAITKHCILLRRQKPSSRLNGLHLYCDSPSFFSHVIIKCVHIVLPFISHSVVWKTLICWIGLFYLGCLYSIRCKEEVEWGQKPAGRDRHLLQETFRSKMEFIFCPLNLSFYILLFAPWKLPTELHPLSQSSPFFYFHAAEPWQGNGSR